MPDATVDLFAGIPVSDCARALTWYERLLGSPPVRKATYRDPDGNEIAFGGGPAS